MAAWWLGAVAASSGRWRPSGSGGSRRAVRCPCGARNRAGGRPCRLAAWQARPAMHHERHRGIEADEWGAHKRLSTSPGVSTASGLPVRLSSRTAGRRRTALAVIGRWRDVVARGPRRELWGGALDHQRGGSTPGASRRIEYVPWPTRLPAQGENAGQSRARRGADSTTFVAHQRRWIRAELAPVWEPQSVSGPEPGRGRQMSRRPAGM